MEPAVGSGKKAVQKKKKKKPLGYPQPPGETPTLEFFPFLFFCMIHTHIIILTN